MKILGIYIVKQEYLDMICLRTDLPQIIPEEKLTFTIFCRSGEGEAYCKAHLPDVPIDAKEKG